MFKNLWNDVVAQSFVESQKEKGIEYDVALRVYTSRLIGGDAELVMHGGGNTSCKTNLTDVYGQTTDVLCIKGSGWDLGQIEAQGLPAVRLKQLLKLRDLESLNDVDMVNVQRSNLIDQKSPNPSVETLLHAFLPYKFVEHTHSSPFLILANLPDCEKITEDLFGDNLGIVPYIMPGFSLAKTAIEIHDSRPQVSGLILQKHGHFTWGDSAESSYERLIEQTNVVQKWLDKKASKTTYPIAKIDAAHRVGIINDIQFLLSQFSEDKNTSFSLKIIDDNELLQKINFLINENVNLNGVVTPDHVIRIKCKPIILEKSVYKNGRDNIGNEIKKYIDWYRKYFDTGNKNSDESKVMLSPLPKVFWVEDIGLIGVGATLSEAEILTDLASQNVRVIFECLRLGGFSPVSEQDYFDMEYWSLEQAKLNSKSKSELFGKVVLITGAAGGIGYEIVKAFEAAGAQVVATDVDIENNTQIINDFSSKTILRNADLTSIADVDGLFECLFSHYGTLDILISNAGIAPQGAMVEMTLESLKKSFDINFFAHFALASRAGKLFMEQGKEGQILVNISKQAVNPGKNFGAYGLPKSSLMFFVKQLALELGDSGIRVNGINADRIRSGIVSAEFIKSRSKSRSLSEDEYMTSNLLSKEVTGKHVAQGFLMLAKSFRTTGHVLTVDGGNIEASLR